MTDLVPRRAVGRQQDSTPVPKLPTGLNNDAQWAALIAWMQCFLPGQELVIKADGRVLMRRKFPPGFDQGREL